MAEINACPNCQRQLQIPETFIGQAVQCPECRHQFQAAAAAGAVQEQPGPTVLTPARARDRGEDEDDTPRRRRPRYEDDDDDDIDRPYRPRRSYHEPHRGSLIMTLGILSIFLAPLILGTIAWVMGNNDLRAMEE